MFLSGRFLVFVGWAICCLAQPRFPMRFVGELGDKPTTIAPGIQARAKMFALRFDGVDRGGTKWSIDSHTTGGGVGNTSVFTSDFDADGHADLLIAQNFTMSPCLSEM